MSLINQALKKAQHERTGQTSDGARGAGPGAPSPIPPPPANHAPLVVMAGGILLLLAAIAGAFLLFLARNGQPQPAATLPPEPPPAEATPAPAAAPLTPPAPALPPQLAAPTPPPAPVPPVVPGAPPTQPPMAAPVAAPAPPVPAMSEEEAAARATIEVIGDSAGLRDERVVAWLAAAEVSGARVSGKSSRVLLNGEAYTIGETVSYTLGLRFVAVEGGWVFFEDGDGTRYAKKY